MKNRQSKEFVVKFGGVIKVEEQSSVAKMHSRATVNKNKIQPNEISWIVYFLRLL